MTLPPLLRPSYWFGLTPAPLTPWVEYTLLACFALFFFAGVIVGLVAMRQDFEKMMRRALQRTSSALMILGAFGLLLFVFSYERIYGLGMRAGYILWVALLAWYAWQTYRLFKIELPEDAQRRAQRNAMNKWIPTSKK